MKLKILFCFLIIPVLFAQAQSVQFENSLKAAFDRAKLENKAVFIEYYNSECPVCKRIEPFFSNERLGKFYNAHFVNYRLNTKNMISEDSLFMSKTKLNLTAVPYFLFFDSNQHFLHHADTKPEVDYLIEIGIKALNPDERDAALENKYNSGDRSIKTLYAYSQLNKLYEKDSLTTILADELFEAFPKADIGNKKSYIITKNCVNSIENGFFKYWIEHMDKLDSLEQGKQKEKQRMADIVLSSVYSKARDHWSLEKIAEVKRYILLSGLSQNPEAFFWEQETKLLAAQKRYDEALQIGKQMLDDEKTGITASVDIVRFFLNNFSTTNELNAIKKWIDDIDLKAQFVRDKADIIYLNALYFTKTNQIEKAKNTIADGLLFYKKNKLDTKDLTDLTNTK